MNRYKVLELAQRADELARHFAFEVPFEVYRLERFAALIEAEVRGDAEPVVWIDSRHLDTISDFDAPVYAKGGFDFAQPLYTHPAPAVVRQLVEALEQLMSIVKIHSRATSNNFAWAEMDFAKEALAAAKEAGL